MPGTVGQRDRLPLRGIGDSARLTRLGELQLRNGSWGSPTLDNMPAWAQIENAEPDYARRVQLLVDAGRHKTLATLRADGSPRISGIECEFVDGELRFGSMPGARKLADLTRDSRFALHGPTVHPVEGKERDWPGEAKIAGHVVPVADDDSPLGDADGQPEGMMFVADISEVVLTRLNDDASKLVIEHWTPRGGLRIVERE